MPLNHQELTNELSAFIDNRPKVSTHCHQLPDRELQPFDLEALLRNSYVNWGGVAWDSTDRSRELFLEKVRFNSFFVWLQKGLQQLYRESSPLTVSTWQSWSDRIQSAYQTSNHAREILTRQCGYRRMLLDAYWEPGSDNGSPEFFAPVYRVNAFFFGYSTGAADHDGNNPYNLAPRTFIADLDEYVGWVRDSLLAHQTDGCVALKIPIAYDRGLDFDLVRDELAHQAFARLTAVPLRDGGADPQDIKTFQDYLFFQICRMAAELDLPVQIHTGMGQGYRTNAAYLQPAIQNFPGTLFVLLHCSYPWIQDISMLASIYPNVSADLSWLPLLSTRSATTMLHELIERTSLDRIFWGCDTWTAEESFGALLAFRHVLASTLAEKVISGYFSRDDALHIIEAILLKNSQRFYKLASAG